MFLRENFKADESSRMSPGVHVERALLVLKRCLDGQGDMQDAREAMEILQQIKSTQAARARFITGMEAEDAETRARLCKSAFAEIMQICRIRGLLQG